MTVSDDTGEAPLWLVGSGRPRPRPVPAKCGLCEAPPASAFGLCSRCLTAAAAEASRIQPRQAPSSDSRRDAVQARDLCRRCGRAGHTARECDA